MPEQSRNADILNTSIYAAVMPENSRCMRFIAWGVYNYTHNRKTPVWACIRLLWRRYRKQAAEIRKAKNIKKPLCVNSHKAIKGRCRSRAGTLTCQISVNLQQAIFHAY